MLDNVKIGAKLIGGFMVVCAITAVIGIVGITSTSRMDTASDRMYEYGLKGTTTSDLIKQDHLYMARAYRNMVIFNDKTSLASFQSVIEKNAAEIPTLLDTLSKLTTRPEVQTLIREAREQFRAYVRDGTAFSELAKVQYSAIPE
ncbi:MAG: MCP four helix bundle domain-containing protein, partial [Chitinispirillia bacterium]|nr:MCP four helix bundle domain-containing protein [Chitinispirillia bacterium]